MNHRIERLPPDSPSFPFFLPFALPVLRVLRGNLFRSEIMFCQGNRAPHQIKGAVARARPKFLRTNSPPWFTGINYAVLLVCVTSVGCRNGLLRVGGWLETRMAELTGES